MTTDATSGHARDSVASASAHNPVDAVHTVGSVTIVIPAHEVSPRIGVLLRSLDSEARSIGTDAMKVVVSDDGSVVPLAEGMTDGHLGLDIEYVRSPVGRGPGAARNRGLDRVSTPWVVFLDSDTVPQTGWLACLLLRIGRPDAPDGLEGRVEAPEGDVTPFTHATRIEATQGLHGGANIAYRADVIREVGGFSEEFYDPVRKIHFREDTELRFRMNDRGVSVVYEPDLVVDHPPLPSSFWTPMRLARRYYFDPLLSSKHPEQFREMSRRRSIAGYSLRRARHDVALAVVLGATVGLGGLIAGNTILVVMGVGVWTAGVLGSGIALFWRREVAPRHFAPAGVAAVIVPWVYVYHYYRGVVRFRHFARMQ